MWPAQRQMADEPVEKKCNIQKLKFQIFFSKVGGDQTEAKMTILHFVSRWRKITKTKLKVALLMLLHVTGCIKSQLFATLLTITIVYNQHSCAAYFTLLLLSNRQQMINTDSQCNGKVVIFAAELCNEVQKLFTN